MIAVFLINYVVGDLVDIIDVSERTGKERIELEGATVVEIRGEGSSADAVVQDAVSCVAEVGPVAVRYGPVAVCATTVGPVSSDDGA